MLLVIKHAMVSINCLYSGEPMVVMGGLRLAFGSV